MYDVFGVRQRRAERRILRQLRDDTPEEWLRKAIIKVKEEEKEMKNVVAFEDEMGIQVNYPRLKSWACP